MMNDLNECRKRANAATILLNTAEDHANSRVQMGRIICS
jgi:hypothetical protein